MSIRADIDRGLEIIAEVEKLQTELKDIEVRVKHAALHGEQVELKDADREGKQFLARGSDLTVPVILTADKLIGSFAEDSKPHTIILHALGGDASRKLQNFYKRTVKFESLFDNGKKFRTKADELFGDRAPGFITACLARDRDGIPKSDIKIMWEETELAKP